MLKTKHSFKDYLPVVFGSAFFMCVFSLAFGIENNQYTMNSSYIWSWVFGVLTALTLYSVITVCGFWDRMVWFFVLVLAIFWKDAATNYIGAKYFFLGPIIPLFQMLLFNIQRKNVEQKIEALETVQLAWDLRDILYLKNNSKLSYLPLEAIFEITKNNGIMSLASKSVIYGLMKGQQELINFCNLSESENEKHLDIVFAIDALSRNNNICAKNTINQIKEAK